MNNLRQIKTTIIGGVLFLIGLTIFLVEYFTLKEMAINHYYIPIGFTLGGILFLLAPDRLLDFLFGWLKSKSK